MSLKSLDGVTHVQTCPFFALCFCSDQKGQGLAGILQIFQGWLAFSLTSGKTDLLVDSDKSRTVLY